MKKINILIIALISIFAFNINVYAASGSLSTNTGSVYVGDSFTVDNLQDYHKFVIAGEKSTEIIQSKLNGASNIEYYDYDYDNNFTNLDNIFNKILEEL